VCFYFGCAILVALLRRKDMPMKNPAHPGRIVRSACLEPLGLSITKGAKSLGVTRQTLNNIINGKSGISPEMAIRLSKAFGSTPETWLRMQLAFDLAAALKDESKIEGETPARPARTAHALTPDAPEILGRGFPAPRVSNDEQIIQEPDP
jgi:addiction module HigA family antidote